MEIVTGYRGTEHVTAEQLGDLQAGYAGYEQCVLGIGEKLRAEAVTANKVRVFDGVLLMYGRQAIIEAGAYEDVEIENGTPGLLRNDMIVAKYVKDENTGIEDIRLAVAKGSAAETATDPTPLSGNIRDGAFENEMPLYRVKINGLAIEKVEPLFQVMLSAAELEEKISKNQTDISILNSNLNHIEYGEGSIEVSKANTVYTVNIIFAKPYQSKPFVIVGATTSAPLKVSVGTMDCSTTGFVITMARTDTATTGYRWVAIGK